MTLSWPTTIGWIDPSLYTLESSTNPASMNWQPVSAPPAIVNGLFTSTNPIAGTQMFYRLSR